MARYGHGIAAAALGALALVGQGCVSLDAYQAKQREADANKQAYVAADTVVGNKQKEIDLLRLKIAAMEKDNAALKTRVDTSDTVLAAHEKSLKEKYEEMLARLKNEQGGDWIVNPSTGGVVLEDSVYFNSGQAMLKAEKFPALDALIGKLKSEFADAVIEIAGHTDSDPIAKSGWKDNFQLSSERARAVLVYLQKKGTDTERMFISGYGPSKPRSDKKNENRRVEIVLHERAK